MSHPLGAAMTRAGKSLADNPHQFHETEPDAPRALIAVEGRRIAHCGGEIWECAAGRGAMAIEFEAAGFRVVATDLVRRRPRLGLIAPILPGIDFLAEPELRAPVIITNPPYDDAAEKFIRHALSLKPLYAAFLLKAHYFNADCRRDLFRSHPPSRIWPLGFRLDWTGQGSPTMECAWFVWDLCAGPMRRHRPAESAAWGGHPASLYMPALPRATPRPKGGAA